MTLTDFIALLIWTASLEMPRPEFFRHELARKQLLRSLRGCG